MANQIQLRRGTSAEWAASTRILAQGEVGIDLTLGEMRLGDGVTAWAGLTSIGAVDPADVDAAVAAYLLANPPAAAPVDSVNGQTGAVVLDASDVGADPAGTAAAAVAAHAGAVDPHPTYTTAAEAAAAAPVQTVAGRAGAVVLAVADVSGAVATTDGRLSDARTPTAHAGSHATGQVDAITPASIGAQPAGSYAPALGADDNYVTDAEKVKLANLSGTNTGDQTLASLGAAPATQAINAQTGTTYTLQASDAGKVVTLTNASAITLTIPGSVFTAGQRVDCLVLGAGMVTAVGSSCTVNGTPSLVSRAQYSAFTVLFTSATTAVLIGDLA